MNTMDTVEIYRYAQEHPEEVEAAQEGYQALLSRSATDLDFRQQLLADPAAAISAFTGRDVPESFNVVFVENRADATIVLPDYIDPAAELTDDELEAVAGGESIVVLGLAILAAGITTGACAAYFVDKRSED